MDPLDSDSDHCKRIHQVSSWTIKKINKITKSKTTLLWVSNSDAFKDFLLDFGTQTSVTRTLPQIPMSIPTMANSSKTKPNTEKLGNNEKKTATTIVLDVVNTDIGDYHALWDKDQNLDDPNLRGKTDLNCLNFSFKTEMENEEVRHKNFEFEESKPYLSVNGSL